MTTREKALHELAKFLLDVEEDNIRIDDYDFRTADYIYGLIYEDARERFADYVVENYGDFEDLKDVLPRKVADAIILWGIY